MKKTTAILLTLAAIASSLLTGCGGEDETIKVGALFAVTGGASFLGAPEARTADMLVEEINADGGVDGKMIELIIKDTAANPEKAISFAKQLIEEDKVVAIIGPSTSGETMQIKELCESYKTPLISCAAAEAIVDPVAKYVFKTPQKDSYVANWVFTTMKEMGIKNIGIVGANTGFGNAGLGQLEKYAPDYGINIIAKETYDKAATDLTAVLTKLKAKDVEAVVNWSIVPAQSIVPKNMKQLGMDVPLFQSHGFGNIKYAEAAGAAAEGIIFPAGQLLVAEKLPASHPQKEITTAYKTQYESKFNEPVSGFGGYAYDSIMLIVKAIEKTGSIERNDIRDGLESISGYAGASGVFNMSASDHNGLDMSSIEMLTVENGEFTLYK
ncbi:MAG: ABC transporter substrate-binding protein [Spirochaetales bacterium]|uniref:ABC transporter substrate-binding protein n=1 Tax=Candidatus Thalassospirochaeta sargassi TaxID=3119039 RepID=A0AAJ1IDB1_9SPIO|nr:ABC transporter substrate-binding protein [Spirochaetales bacterium]